MTDPTAPSLQTLDERDLDAAAHLLAVGFAEEPGMVALVPDEGARHRFLVRGSRAQLRALLPHGSVHGAVVDGELAALALWEAPALRPGTLASGLAGLVSTLRQAPDLVRAVPAAAPVVVTRGPSMALAAARRRRAVESASRGTTWHLAFLATAPAFRGRGLARALLDKQLRRCDEDGQAVWLETTDPVNPPIYARFGFTTVLHLDHPGWLPGLWVMRREPVPVGG